MKAECPLCNKSFDLDLEAGDVRCPHCAAPLRAESFGETQTIDVKSTATGADAPQLKLKLRPSDTTSSVPKYFAGYRILSELGRGGMGVVYKAVDPKLDRTVAIKVLLAAEHASGNDIGRFFREALSVAKLQHPNIVPIYELKVHDDRHYFTMDYVEGQPLDKLIRDKRPGLRRSLEIVEKVARALDHAHNRGVVHRDLKPANIIITPENEPKVTDFGLAKTASLEGQGQLAKLTKTGLAIGTPHYMAPEQAAGRSKEADARTDVYSLGCVLYELLSGRPPFQDASAMGVIQKHIEETPSPPSGRGGMRLPEDVITVCMKCLEKEPARRYRTAGQLAEDLRRFLDGQPIAARRASMVYLVRRQIVRHKAASLVAIAALGLLVAVVAGNIRRLQRERNQSLRQLYYSNIALAQSYAQDANVAQADRILMDCAPEFRGWEWGRVRREAHQELLTIRLSGPPTKLRFAADGSRVSAEVGGQLLTFDARTGSYREAQPLPVGSPRLGSPSPDGKLLARKGARGFVHVTDARSGKRIKSFEAHAGQVSQLAFGKPDLLATTGTDKMLRIWQATTGKKLHEIAAHTKAVSALRFSSDGKLLAVGDVLGLIRLWNTKSGKLVRTLNGHTADISQLKYCPDGKRLASASVDRTIRVWELASGQELLCLRGHADSVSEVAWSPKGDRLASLGFGHMLKLWDARQDRTYLRLSADMTWIASVAFAPEGGRLYAGGSGGVAAWDPATGREILRWPEAPLPDCYLALSPDGRHLASGGASGRIKLRETASGKLTREFKYPGEILTLAFGPNGGQLAAGGSGGTIKVWEVASGRELIRPAGHAGTVRALTYSLDGRFLASGGEDRTVRVWDVVNGRQIRKVTGGAGSRTTSWAVAFSPDGERLAAAFINRIRVVQVATGREHKVLHGHAVRVYSLAFSPDGRRLASASKDGTVRLWDAETGRELLKLKGHSDWVVSVAFSPDGRRLASASRDGTVRVWLADDWQEGETAP